MIEASTRLRRAILLNDALLVQRIIRSHPHLLHNPDFADKSNTSLHLAAQHGLPDICSLLISLGHDAAEISRNTDHNTPLMLAAQHGNPNHVGLLLAQHFPQSIPFHNTLGLDALALAAQSPAATALISVLLRSEICPANVDGRDGEGNAPLHHASASGSLKALRILLAHGANPLVKNKLDWTPLAYSQTVAAEVYFKNLILEGEKRRRGMMMMMEGGSGEEARPKNKMMAAGGGGAVRLVSKQEQDEGVADGEEQQLEEQVIGDALKRHWSPVERRRPGTPGGGTPRHEWGSPPLLGTMRTRSGDGRSRAESG